ncbi:hypothetical protein [Chryseobacterium sp. 3008163]|uniref:hypothetical protein n=1 Tax=Chryseobacterium sp. 3008163 TaxID=2478663 RepID=UPI000F0C9E79|nr:hypothetical protein [Chryseobacterium sp. 3008163]AYN00093.1 hypothetical protein EAG08_06910 [Chryseobacterium sp. 3008163]
MKSYLNLLFIFCFTIFSAQNKELNSSSQKVKVKTDTILNVNNEKSQSYNSDSALLLEKKEKNLTDDKKIKSPDHKKASETKSDTEKSIADQNINIVQEINAVLNYKVNRVWRKDLYCLVCIKNSNPGRAA